MSVNVSVRKIKKRSTRVKPTSRPTVTKVPSNHRKENKHVQYFTFRYKVGDNLRRKLTFKRQVYNYGPDKCLDAFDKNRVCPDGKKCSFAHSTLEVMFHPLVYKTSMCKKLEEKDGCRQGRECAWAHDTSEIRDRRRIFGWNWRVMDPNRQPLVVMEESDHESESVSVSEMAVSIHESVSSKVSTSGSAWSSRTMVTASPVPTRTSSPVSRGTPSMSDGDRTLDVSVDGHGDEVAAEAKVEETPIGETKSFERWFTEWYDVEDERLPYGEYLSKFQSTNFDDISFLWELCWNEHNYFVDVLEDVIGWTNSETRDIFEECLCLEIDRIGEAVELLAGKGLNDDDLVEMGVSSAGHRARILYCLR